uniref:Acyl-(Acyl-carrier-protein) desaturase, chloroplastic n=1 Tax=Aegilops tauschii TaxID=37682 RepID=M8D4F5_AEGTA
MPAQAHPTWCRSRAAARAGRWACKVTATANFEDTVTGMPAQEQAEAEVVRSLGLSGWVEEQLLPLLTPVDDAWQPSDLLPCFSLSAAGLSAEQQPSMMMTTEELQAQASGVPDDVLVCLVGNMMLRPSSPYHNAIYGSFQERATFISHAHTAKQAARHGDRCLAKICGVVAADEKRHETAYTKVAAKVFELDPDGMVQALAAVLRDKITMPGQLMTDGRDADLFEHFSAVAQRTGVYTARDYGDMVEHFVRRWKVADLGGGQLSGEGRRAQEYVCGLPRKIRRVEELAHDRVIKAAKEPEFARFSWVFDRPVCIRSLI